MQNDKRNTYYIFRAIAVTAFAFLVCWALAQKAQEPASKNPDPETLLARLDALNESEDYPDFLLFSDTLLQLFAQNGMRSDWYKVLRTRTIRQKKEDEADLAVLQLVPILQQQVIADSFTAKIYGLLGFACLNSEAYVQGAWYYEQSLAGLIKHHCKNGLGTAYMNLGFSLKMQGDYQSAKPYYLTAIPLLEKEQNLFNLSESFVNLGDISRFTGAFEEARSYYHRAAEVYPENGENLESNLGWSYSDEGRPVEALQYFKISQKKFGLDAELARGMSHECEALGDTIQANFLYTKALSLASDPLDSCKALVYKGSAQLERKQSTKAVLTFQTALHLLYPALQSDHFEQNPKPKEAADFWTVKTLQGKAKALTDIYSHTQKSETLFLAESCIQTAMQALDSFRLTIQNEISSQDALDYTYYTYETGIQTALLLDQLNPGQGLMETAYNRAEKAKSSNLKQSLAEKELRQAAQVPDRLLSKEKQLNAVIIYWEELKQTDSLLAAVRQLQKVQDTIENLVPSIQKSRLQTRNVSLAEIQHNLKENELLLQYFWGNEEVLAFAIDKHHLTSFRLSQSAELKTSLDTLRKGLTQWTDPIVVYEAKAQKVYQAICQPVLAQFPKTKRLIIIPDGPLFNIPFEALQRENHRFLAEDLAISYHWSGALWLQARQQGQQGPRNDRYGGFAPEYTQKAELASVMGSEVSDLPEARAAVSATGKAWDGPVWTGPTVDKDLFLREAGNFGVLHLALHGVMDPVERTQTGLLFPNNSGGIDLLNTLTISQMNLKAQVAVLSACNTASGKIYRGEGVMSLSRAFALAGCPAVVANLWEVPSLETNAIASQFLELLRAGKSKDVALQQAKQNYLANAFSERKHPYFWAGQVLVGNEAPIQKPVNGILFMVLMLVLGLIFAYALIINRRK